MNVKKALLIGCPLTALAGVAVIAGIVFLVFSLTRGATEAADRFLALVGEAKHHEAWLSTAGAVRAQQDEAEFVRTIERLGLDEAASASWSSRRIVNDEATLEGSVTTNSGGAIPVTIKLLKEQGEWKVLSITGPEAGVQVATTRKQVPPDAELRRLVTSTLLDFNAAIQAEDFTGFHESVSTAWQQQITPAQLLEAFQSLIDREVDLAAIEEVPAVFSEPPGFDENGMLVVQGFYPTRPVRVAFELTYAYEHPEWKLFGINVGLHQVDAQD
ncbi:MAG TPA: hypothetical protein VML55_06360 [Planctomycetaceae bacterium]|nr:hypothetical protein [Planctomycetaceae bacterium]